MTTAASPGRYSPLRGRVWKTLSIVARRRPAFVVGLFLVGIFVIAGLVSLVWVPIDPTQIDTSRRYVGPLTDSNVLGTDRLGRDILSGLMVAARTSLSVAFLGSFIALIFGITIGLVAATLGGIVEEFLMRTSDVMLAIPGVVFALVLAAKLGPGTTTMIIALAFFFTPSFARVTRSAAATVLQEGFTTAARIYGRSRRFIARRHVLPNIAPVLIVQFTGIFASGILIETSLSYIGAGVSRPDISFGIMLLEAQNSAGADALVTIWPGLAVVLPVLGLNILGDAAREILDPKQVRSHES